MDMLYIEKDGRVFLVEKEGRLTFPEEVDFKVEVVAEMDIEGKKVKKCELVNGKFHPEWHHKDMIFLDDKVSDIVKKAVVLSYPRPTSNAFIIKDWKILMLKPTRGLCKDWNTPGGFIEYGENPQDAVLREIREEIGTEGKIKAMVGIHTYTFPETNYHMINFSFLCDIEGTIKINEDENSEYTWMELDEAKEKTGNVFVKLAIEDLKKVMKYVGLQQ